jgi:hypothetical protein
MSDSPQSAPPAAPQSDPTLGPGAHVASVTFGGLAALAAAWLSSSFHIPPDVAVWLVGSAGAVVTSLAHWFHARLYHGGPIARANALWFVVMVAAIAGTAGLTGCSVFAPAKAGCGAAHGQTLETCAYSLFGTYVVFEGQAASLIQNPQVPSAIKLGIQRADGVAAPIMERGRDLSLEYVKISAQFKAGATGADRLALVTQHLQAWLLEAEPAISQLVAAVKAAGKG